MKMNTVAIHAARGRESDTTDITEPIHMTSSFEFRSLEEAQDAFAGRYGGFVYGRVHNPSQALLERRLAEMESGRAAVATSSGIAAISNYFLSSSTVGDVVVAHNCLYGNTYRFFEQTLQKSGVLVRYADLLRISELQKAICDRTRFVFLETPTNPFLEVIDLEAIAGICQASGIKLVVDSTLSSPALQNPISQGADVVIHSLSKYIGGHGDLLGGVVIGNDDSVNAVRAHGLRYATGATLSPFNAYLALRGLKTLGLRMAQHSATALALAERLSAHSAVEAVHYPSLSSDPKTAKYMPSGGGGVLSFKLKRFGDIEPFFSRLKFAKIAVSLGTCETLVEHPRTMTHSSYSVHAPEGVEVPEELVRVAVGLEDTEDVVQEILQALG